MKDFCNNRRFAARMRMKFDDVELDVIDEGSGAAIVL